MPQDKTCHSLLLVKALSHRGRAPSRPSGSERTRAAASRRAAWTGGGDAYNERGGNGRRSPSVPVPFIINSIRLRPASIRICREPVNGSMPVGVLDLVGAAI